MRKIFIFIVILSLCSFMSFNSYAQEESVESPVVEEQDTLKESMEYYAKIVIQYVVSIGGTITGLLIIISKIKKILKEVKDGTRSVKTAKEELAIERKNLELAKEELANATKILSEFIKNQKELDKLSVFVDKLMESLKVIVSNDSKLVSSGTAKEITTILNEMEDKTDDKQEEIHNL